MSLGENVTPLLVHTLDTLCNELVSGRGVELKRDGRVVRLDSAAARAVFDWYRRNRGKWAGQNRKEDVRDIAREVDKEPPMLPALNTRDTSKPVEVVYLKRIRAHRFAGIHRYGTVDQPPPDFEFEFEHAGCPGVWVIEGSNAAGKTSLLSAICWCLTGHVYRSQREPETAHEPIPVCPGDIVTDGEEDTTGHDISAITPVPPRDVLEELGEANVPLDTWVELTFADAHGRELETIRRSVTRSRRGGQIEITEPDFSGLGLPPIALEVGTRMTGLLPYVQVGEKSDLSSAVAELTGLRPLRDLVKHAKKSREKLQAELPRERAKEITSLDAEYALECDELARVLDEHKYIAPKRPIPRTPAGTACEDEIASLKAHFEDLQATALAGAEAVLGDTFDKRDRESREDLVKSIGPALAATDFRAIANLASAMRLYELGRLTETELGSADAIIETLLHQAEEIAELEEKEDVAARIRLYAKIAEWLKDTDPLAKDVTACPVCDTNLAAREDGVTHRPIVEHIREFLRADKSHLQYAVSKWARQSVNKLSGQLHQTLSSELKRNLPDHPADLISDAFCKELFALPAFSQTLAPLKATVARLCEQHLPARATFVEPTTVTFPEAISPACQELADAISRVRRAIAFARWRHGNARACKQSLLNIIGTESVAPECSTLDEKTLKQSPLLTQLKALEGMVVNSEPLQTALTRAGKMNDLLAGRRSLQRRMERYGRAAKAIAQLFQIEQLVDDQVGSLMQTLSRNTRQWRDELYRPAYTDAPSIAGADVANDGSLLVHAEAGGTRAPAQHICNASDLRATLLAFLLAFWKHLSDTQGALSLLMLDDLQELFDPHNRRRVAHAIPQLAKEGAQVLLTTNDHEFGRMVCGSAHQAIGTERTIHRQALPAKAGNLRMALSEFREAIQRKREAFDKKENDHEAAREYLNELRIYLDARLLNLFDIADPAMPPRPTLADLVNAARRRVNQGMESFSGQVFRELATEPALRDGSEFLRLINDSHHGRANLITYTDVAGIAVVCDRVLDLVHAAAEEYERWLRRDPPEPLPVRPALPSAGRNLSFTVPLILATAAAGQDSPMYEVVEAEEPFICHWVANHAIYINTTDNLGFAGSKNCRLVVDLNGDLPEDNSLVVALYRDKAYVRRLLHILQDASVVGLAAETPNPLHRPPTLLVPKSQVTLLQVVGIIFDNEPVYPRPKDEATIDDKHTVMERVEVAFKVRGESALPLVLPGQTILGGAKIRANELGSNEGEPVVIATTEGTAFKRVGKVLSGAQHVRKFESIGGLGESIMVRTEEQEDDPFRDLPELEDVRKILGVLYDPNE